MRAAQLHEALLKAHDRIACVRIARRNRATRARIAALEVHFANAEAHDAAFFFPEELIFPKRGDAVDFERGAKTQARFVYMNTGEPRADRIERRSGNDRRSVGD